MTALAAAAPPATGPALLTVEEFVARHGGDYVELVNGVVKELPVPQSDHGWVCGEITRLVGNYAVETDSGRMFSHDTFVRTGPAGVRGPDVAFVSYERLPRGPRPKGVIEVAPEVVVEVKSPSDRWGKLFVKVGEYLEAGVRAVIVLDPEMETASVYRPDGKQQIFRGDDELTVPDVLPGFAAPLRRLFG